MGQCEVSKVPKQIAYLVPKNGRFYFRIRIPDDLRETIGKKEHSEALGDLNKAQAGVAAARLGAQWLARFLTERHRLGIAPSPPPPESVSPPDFKPATLEQIQAIAAIVGRSMLLADEELRIDGGGPAPTAEGMGIGPHPDTLTEAVAGRNLEAVTMQAEDWIGSFGLTLPPDGTERRRILYAFAQGLGKAQRGQRQRDAGEPVDTPPEAPLPDVLRGPELSTLSPRDKPASALRMRDVFELWRAKRPKTPAAKSVEVANRVVELFEQTLGNPPLVKLTRSDGIKMRDAIVATGVSARTAGNLLGWLITLMRYEIKELRRLESNPWDGLEVEGSNERKQKRVNLKTPQLQALFSDPLFQTYLIPKRAKNAGLDAAYWLPLMVAFTGARVTELAQLLVSDLVQEDGVWYVHIRVTYPEWQKLKGYYPGVTDGPSVRCVPIHAELVRLGLPEYASAIKAAGHERLFPMVPVSEVNNAGGSFSSWFSSFKTARGLGPEHTFHSFRHTVETSLKRLKENPFHINQLTGHAQPGGEADDTYTHLEHHDLIGTVALIQYPGIALPRAWPPMAWTAPTPAQTASLATSKRKVGRVRDRTPSDKP